MICMPFESRWVKFVVLAILLGAWWNTAVCALDFPGPAPGEAQSSVGDTSLVLENEALSMSWTVAKGRLGPGRLVEKLSGTTLPLEATECFAIVLDDSPSPRPQIVKSSALTVLGQPAVERLEPAPQALRIADRCPGRQITVHLGLPGGNLEVQWRATLRDGANYVQQQVLLRAKDRPAEVGEIVLFDLTAPQAEVQGVVDGSPVVAGPWFFACEHPRSRTELSRLAAGGARHFRCILPCQTGLTPDNPLAARSVVGVAPHGQLRRSFLYYLERERAVPYRPLLHYNNGSEIGCQYWKRRLHGTPEEAEAFRRNQERIWIENIRAFGRELVEKRGGKLDSFAHDFEWDDETLVWQFHEGYPQGFAPARQAAAAYGVPLGVWLSPWGGYPGKKARVEEGRKLGFETNPLGLSLAGPRYYARFAEACRVLVGRYGVNYFKFDGFAPGNNQPGPGPYGSDVDALLRLIGELRGLKPDVFVNPSTGSWPSPFWLLWADSIWRQGSDTNVAGKGSERQKWITYRDSQILQGVVQRAPLYPITSLMIHGVFVNELPLFGNPYDPKKSAPTVETSEVVAEIRSFFGTGANLQELYIEPKRMTAELWDALAEAARWSRANADVLVDAHWIGGDPAKDEVYGWASWSPRKAILTLRNPNDQPAAITLDLGQAFELPAGAAQQYVLRSPWKEDSGKPPLTVAADQAHRFELPPFGVLVWEGEPVVRTP